MIVLKSPPHSPKANAICERVIGTIRRECLDWLIPLSESHLRSMLKVWVTHYNGVRPHMALGPCVPDPPTGSVLAIQSYIRLKLLTGLRRSDLLRLQVSSGREDGIHVRTNKIGKAVIYTWTPERECQGSAARAHRPVPVL